MFIFIPLVNMPNNYCVCGRMKSADCKITLHRFPKKLKIRKKWLDGLELAESDVTVESRVYSMHFCDGDVKTIPSIHHIGVKFADVTHSDTARSKRHLSCESQKEGEISNHQHLPVVVLFPAA